MEEQSEVGKQSLGESTYLSHGHLPGWFERLLYLVKLRLENLYLRGKVFYLCMKHAILLFKLQRALRRNVLCSVDGHMGSPSGGGV